MKTPPHKPTELALVCTVLRLNPKGASATVVSSRAKGPTAKAMMWTGWYLVRWRLSAPR